MTDGRSFPPTLLPSARSCRFLIPLGWFLLPVCARTNSYFATCFLALMSDFASVACLFAHCSESPSFSLLRPFAVPFFNIPKSEVRVITALCYRIRGRWFCLHFTWREAWQKARGDARLHGRYLWGCLTNHGRRCCWKEAGAVVRRDAKLSRIIVIKYASLKDRGFSQIPPIIAQAIGTTHPITNLVGDREDVTHSWYHTVGRSGTRQVVHGVAKISLGTLYDDFAGLFVFYRPSGFRSKAIRA